LSLYRYTSEILKYQSVTLGSAEAVFLNNLMGKPKSAYVLASDLKNSGHPMAYKNVYTRIRRLEDLKLIEKVPEKFPHGAIYYRLTTQGLMFQISRFVNIDDSLMWSDFLDNYAEHIIFKTLVLPYFEEETIRHSNFTLYFALLFYLGECYQITLDAADRIRKAIAAENDKAKKEYNKQLIEDLQRQARIFAFRLVTDIPRRKGGGVVLPLLAKDKKFLKLMAEVHQDLDRGFTAVKSIHDKYYRMNHKN
jgi:hypothetical protein